MTQQESKMTEQAQQIAAKETKIAELERRKADKGNLTEQERKMREHESKMITIKLNVKCLDGCFACAWSVHDVFTAHVILLPELAHELPGNNKAIPDGGVAPHHWLRFRLSHVI